MALAAAAGPLAVDVPVREELSRHDVQAFAHVFADAGHRLAAARRRAGGVLGLVVVIDASQMIGQHLAARATRSFLGLGRRLGQRSLQRGKLRLQVGLVLQQRVLEHLPLIGRHALALGAELPALQARELEGDLLDLRVAERNVAVLALQQLLLEFELVAFALQFAGLVPDVLEHLPGQRGDGVRGQTLQVLRLEVTHAEHALHLAKRRDLTPLADVLSTPWLTS